MITKNLNQYTNQEYIFIFHFENPLHFMTKHQIILSFYKIF